jgi:TLC domain
MYVCSYIPVLERILLEPADQSPHSDYRAYTRQFCQGCHQNVLQNHPQLAIDFVLFTLTKSTEIMDFDSLLPPLALKVGLSSLGAHIVLTLLLKSLPSGPWSKSAALTAHQFVCLCLMIKLAFDGFVVWLKDGDDLYAAGMEGRIFGLSPRGRDFGSFVWGMMLLWDIPVRIFIPVLQDSLMLLHHVGMMLCAGVTMGIFSEEGQPLGSYYAPFFFGVVEFSTIFLTIVDLFHPKNKEWHGWLEESKSPAASAARVLNDVFRPVFAVSFLLVRCVLFPYIMVTTCLPDFWKASLLETHEERHGVSKVTFKAVFTFSLLFTLLQLYWGTLVAKQIAKVLGLLPNTNDERTKKD